MTTKISPYKTISNQNGSMSGSFGTARHTTYDQWKQSWNGYRFPPPPADCVLYMPGYPYAGSIIKDFSGQGNNGDITGATWVRLPSGLWVLSFDGNDDVVTMPSNVSEHSAAGELPISILLWLKLTATDTNGGIISKGAANKYEWELEQTSAGTGIMRFRLFSPTAASSIGREFDIPADWAGVWKCICVTYSGNPASSGVKIYADGSRVDTDDSEDLTPAYPGQTDNGEPVRLGRTWDTGAVLNGLAALPRIFNTELAAAFSLFITNQERHAFGV